MNFSFTYSDIIKTVATWIAQKCCNTTVVAYNSIDRCFLSGYLSSHTYQPDEWDSGGHWDIKPQAYINPGWWQGHRSDYHKEWVDWPPYGHQKKWETPVANIKIDDSTAIDDRYIDITIGQIQDHIQSWLNSHFVINQQMSVNGLLTFSELIIFYIKRTIRYRVSYLSDNWYLEYKKYVVGNPTNIYIDSARHDDLVRLYQTIEERPTKAGLLEYIFKNIIHASIKYISVKNITYTFDFGNRPDAPQPEPPPPPTDIHVECCAVSANVDTTIIEEYGRDHTITKYINMQLMPDWATFGPPTKDESLPIITISRTDHAPENYAFEAWGFDDTYDYALSTPNSPGYVIEDNSKTLSVQFNRNGTTYISCIYAPISE